MIALTDEGAFPDIPLRQVDEFLDWCFSTNQDPSSLEARRTYFDQVAAWNTEHGLTGTCANPDCQKGIREGREFCSFTCWHLTNKNTNQKENRT